MKYGARNALTAKVKSVKKGNVMSLVKFEVIAPPSRPGTRSTWWLRACVSFRPSALSWTTHSIKHRVLPSGKVSFDAERSARGGHADRFWAIALACPKKRGPTPSRTTEIGIRVIG